MASIFISYRRNPAKPHADLLREKLVNHFGDAEVFLDEASIAPGEFWRARLHQELEKAIVVLAVIDSAWVDSFGKRPEGEDFVRFELETAIQLRKTIMPLVVGGHELKVAEALEKLPPALHPIFERQVHPLYDRTAAYATSIKSLIEAIENLDERVAAVEDQIVERLTEKDYFAAEHLLVRQASSVRPQANHCVYLALARLAGRSFNELDPADRQTIELLLLRAHAEAPDLELPKLLLATMEIDYYELNGLASDIPVKPTDVVHGGAGMNRRSLTLLSDIKVSSRARRELGLDSLLSGTARC
jgi:hypothetical protein